MDRPIQSAHHEPLLIAMLCSWSDVMSLSWRPRELISSGKFLRYPTISWFKDSVSTAKSRATLNEVRVYSLSISQLSLSDIEYPTFCCNIRRIAAISTAEMTQTIYYSCAYIVPIAHRGNNDPMPNKASMPRYHTAISAWRTLPPKMLRHLSREVCL